MIETPPSPSQADRRPRTLAFFGGAEVECDSGGRTIPGVAPDGRGAPIELCVTNAHHYLDAQLGM